MSDAQDDNIMYSHLCFNWPMGDWGSILNPVLVKEFWARAAAAGDIFRLE